LSEFDEPANCTCRDCRILRLGSTVVALRECIRVRTAERDALAARVDGQSRDIGSVWKKLSILERRNRALSLEVEALETEALTLRMELEEKP
jgi:cell division protein FtsB